MTKKATKRSSTAKAIKCNSGYSFRKIGRNRFALMRRNNNTGVTVECKCDVGGACEVRFDPLDQKKATCLSSNCKGSCGWTVKVSGLSRFLTFRV